MCPSNVVRYERDVQRSDETPDMLRHFNNTEKRKRIQRRSVRKRTQYERVAHSTGGYTCVYGVVVNF